MVGNLLSIAKRKETHQITSLYISMGLGMVLGFATTIVNTHLLTPEDFGNLRLLTELFRFTTVVFVLGFGVSLSRLLAQRDNEDIRNQLIGGGIAITLAVSLAMIIVLFVCSFYVDELFHGNLGRLIRLYLPLLFVFPSRIILENIMQGDNRIFQLAVFRIAPQFLYILGALLFSYFFSFSLSASLGIQLIFAALVVLFMSWLCQPGFSNVRRTTLLISRETRSYGFHVYLGSLANVATAHLISLFLGYFVNPTSVGFYSLAVVLTMPLIFIPSVFGTVLFKRFANSRAIPTRAFAAAVGLSVLTLTTFILLIDKVIVLAFSSEYGPVVPLSYLMAFGSIFHGFGDFINRFLGAHGKGRELRNTAFLVGIAILIGCSTLIPSHGALGAAFTKALSSMVYCGMMFFFYRRFRIMRT